MKLPKLSLRDLFWLVLVQFAITAPTALFAREVPAWDYETLVKESDLVVVASVESSKQVDHDFSKEPDFAKMIALPEVGDEIKRQLFARETTLRVHTVLRGTFREKQLKLLHFDWKEEPEFLVNGPSFLGIAKLKEEKDPRQRSDIDPAEFLFFLKKGKDGRFIAVIGQEDPSYSVRALSATRELRLPTPIRP